MTDERFSLDAHPLDIERARRLRGMKALAVSLLIAAAAVFIVTSRVTDAPTWIGYVRAASEAAMVGAIADWFAVTALFRYPLGIPIPHTALIPRSKDAIGRGLGEFVQRNFLTADHVAERVAEADIPGRLGVWLSEGPNVDAAAAQIAGFAEAAIELVKDEDVQASIEHFVARRAGDIEVAPLLARGVDVLIAEGYHETLVEASLRGIGGVAADNKKWLRQRLGEESPWWVPAAVDDAVFERIFEALDSFLADVADQPEHPIRKTLTARATEFARKLEDDPELLARLEEMKGNIVNHPEFRSWAASLWTDAKRGLIAGLTRPDGEMRSRIATVLESFGASLRSDPELRARVDRWLATFARSVATQGGDEAARVIATTVERWDPAETSRRLELQIGRDLQFIRINGTLVGAMVGVVIHAVRQVL